MEFSRCFTFLYPQVLLLNSLIFRKTYQSLISDSSLTNGEYLYEYLKSGMILSSPETKIPLNFHEPQLKTFEPDSRTGKIHGYRFCGRISAGRVVPAYPSSGE